MLLLFINLLFQQMKFKTNRKKLMMTIPIGQRSQKNGKKNCEVSLIETTLIVLSCF